MPKGYSSSGDIVTRTRDGQDLNAIWNSFQEALTQFNASRQPLIDLLSFGVTNIIEDVVQPGTQRFERATEFGIPQSLRAVPTVTQRAYPFEWWDTRQGYTFQFLSGGQNGVAVSSQQLDAVMSQVMEADNYLQFEQTMKALFNSANRTANVNGAAYTVTALYNADSSYIPTYKGQSFPGSHTHYFTTGAASLDSTDLTDVAGTVEHHGFTRANGYNIILLVNPTEAAVIATFRRGVVNNNTQTSNYDFIPSQGQNTTLLLPPGYILAGDLPSNTFAKLDVVGSWGSYLIVQDYQIPAGYIVAAATQGRNTSLNIVGIREHSDAALRGLVLRPGNNMNYPLIDSFFLRGLGAGVAQRGAAAVMQVTASGSYTVPASLAW